MVAKLGGGPDLRVVCSMHCLLGKGYAGGGEHDVLRHGLFSSSLVRKFDVKLDRVISDGILALFVFRNDEEPVKLESLILAQNERWRQA